jgi:hypothetical protein
MFVNQVVIDDSPIDEMLLDDAFEDRWIAPCVPRPLRVDHGDWTALADAKAIGLAAQDAALL